MAKKIRVKGAREHNLKNISVDIDRNQLVVITGMSGSGKSSLAFDTIYAEGQRRYVESLSSYARMFLGKLDKPDVDSIEGLSPAISIEQKTTHKNPRSTVGTVTEIYDYFRLLFARIGVPHCYECGKKLEAQPLDSIIERVLSLPLRFSQDSFSLQILSPLVKSKKGEFRDLFESLMKEGFLRVRVDGENFLLEDEIVLQKNKKHSIDLVVDRLVLHRNKEHEVRSRIAESLETALSKGAGLATLLYKANDKMHEEIFSSNLSCSDCNISFPEINHRFFSFNAPDGACSHCSGIGYTLEFHPNLLIRNPKAKLSSAFVQGLGWAGDSFWYNGILEALAKELDFSLSHTWESLSKEVQQIILYGSQKIILKVKWKDGEEYQFKKPFEGIIPNLHRRYETTQSENQKRKMEQYMTFMECPVCKGTRLRKEALHVTIHNKNIDQISRLSIALALQFFENLKISETEKIIAEQALKEIVSRLRFLNSVGLNYLTLDRIAGTLSGGEAQRIRLATQIGSALVGVLYVLDEPSIGLHQSDNQKLITALKDLRDLGNTVVVVEHDDETMKAANQIIDMGPQAGIHGGNIVFSGNYNEILKHKQSLTGQYLSGKLAIAVPSQRRKGNGKTINILQAEENNLKKIDVEIPLGCLVVITGVSGSGKSTLINEILYKGVMQYLHGSHLLAGKHKKISGLENIDKMININQEPIGRTPRSNPATYTGMFTPIRELFAALPAAQMRGYKPGRFSFNVHGGRCEACQGDGVKKIEMHFLSDVYITCEVCSGKRYKRETLEVKYKGKNIYDVLQMSVEEAFDFFENIPAVKNKLSALMDVGLSYISLGQAATTFSGGEAQRIKLATELSKRSTGKTFYILDEPTTGLHFEDIRQLLITLQRFVEQGNSVVVIEHNMDIIKTADWIIDLGPHGGDQGGEVVARGTPEELIKNKKSLTGKYLKRWL